MRRAWRSRPDHREQGWLLLQRSATFFSLALRLRIVTERGARVSTKKSFSLSILARCANRPNLRPFPSTSALISSLSRKPRLKPGACFRCSERGTRKAPQVPMSLHPAGAIRRREPLTNPGHHLSGKAARGHRAWRGAWLRSAFEDVQRVPKGKHSASF